MPPRKIRLYVGAPSWIITFADLSTLLLTFFVLLISFSNQDIIKFREMLGSVKGAFGVEVKREGEYQAALTGEGTKDVKKQEEEKKKAEAEKLKRQLLKVSAGVKHAAEKAGMSKDAKMTMTPEGLLVRVKGESLFAPGSAKINPKSTKLLDGLASILRQSGLSIKIEGHTDNVPMRSAMYASNWELSGARAAVLARYLIMKKVDPKRISAVGYADMRPIADNSTPEGRAKNRRAEFLVKKR